MTVVRRIGLRAGAATVALVLLAGCATRETTAKGAILGAGSGAIVGAVTSGNRAGRNAVLGAIIGGLLGALVGESIAQREAVAAAGPPTPPGQWTVLPAPPPPTPPGAIPAPPPDPTRGVITNSTPWEVHVFIDQPPGSPGPLVLRPGQAAPVNLDIGKHRIVAQAFVDTQFGRRLVGTFDQILAVDPRAPGWTIRFFEANF